MTQEFVQSVKDTVNEQLSDVHTALPGRIVSVDTASGTCTVLPVMRAKKGNGGYINYPQISGVPIVFPQGGGQGMSVTYPVTAGDGCLLVISEQSLDYWMYGRTTDTDLKFDISNAVCIPGLFQQLPESFANACSDEAVIVDADGVRLSVSPKGVNIKGSLTVSGAIKGASISATNGNVSASGNISADGSVTAGSDVTAGGISLKSHTHTSSNAGSSTSSPK
jgi:hypothetical protein